ncbi:hypothetical protein ABID59_002166 [Bradyrhizobium sp. S3.3.6]
MATAAGQSLWLAATQFAVFFNLKGLGHEM